MRVLAGRGWWRRGRALAAWVAGAAGRALPLPWPPGAGTRGALDRLYSSAARQVTAPGSFSSVLKSGRVPLEGLEVGRASSD